MRPKTLLVLFLLVAGLGAFIWFFERDLPGSDERAQLDKRVVALEPQQITEVVLERGKRRVRVERPPAEEQVAAESDDPATVKRQWRLLEPYDARADTAAVDRLVESLATLEKERTLEEVDREAVGLTEPRASVTLRTADAEATLEVGSEIPASSRMVVATTAGTYVVADSIWSTLEKEPGEWRARSVFPLHRGAVESIELAGSTADELALVRRGETFWLERPIEDLAESDRVNELLDAMFRIEVESFFDAPKLTPEEMGLAVPAGHVAVAFTGRDEPVVLELGGAVTEEGDERYARIDGQIVSIGNDLDEAIGRTAAEWQATAWTALEVYEIDSFRVVDQAGESLLERAGADWSRDGVRISYSPVSDFLYALTGAAGERVLERDAVAEELGEPALQLTVKGSEAEEELSLYERPEGMIATREGRRYLLALSAGTVDDLRVKLQAIRDEPPVTADDEQTEEG